MSHPNFHVEDESAYSKHKERAFEAFEGQSAEEEVEIKGTGKLPKEIVLVLPVLKSEDKCQNANCCGYHDGEEGNQPNLNQVKGVLLSKGELRILNLFIQLNLEKLLLVLLSFDNFRGTGEEHLYHCILDTLKYDFRPEHFCYELNKGSNSDQSHYFHHNSLLRKRPYFLMQEREDEVDYGGIDKSSEDILDDEGTNLAGFGFVSLHEGELIDGERNSEVDEVGKCWEEDNEEIVDKLLVKVVWICVLLQQSLS